MMTRYIDADVLMKELEREVELADDWKTAHEIVNVVKYAPAVDVAPVKHAIWIQKEHWKPLAWDSSPLDWDNYDEKTHSEKVFYWHCSDCDYERSRSIEPKDRYCPHCGAKMDFEEIITNDRFKEEE